MLSWFRRVMWVGQLSEDEALIILCAVPRSTNTWSVMVTKQRLGTLGDDRNAGLSPSKRQPLIVPR